MLAGFQIEKLWTWAFEDPGSPEFWYVTGFWIFMALCVVVAAATVFVKRRRGNEGADFEEHFDTIFSYSFGAIICVVFYGWLAALAVGLVLEIV